MSLGSDTSRNNYVGDGATSVFDYTFKIFLNSDLLVTVKDTSDVETTLTLNTDYTVSGAGLAGGGDITLVDSGQAWLDGDGDLLTDYVITIRRVIPLTQDTDIRNQGDFFPEAHENQFDRGIMIDQQQQDEIDRSVKFSETSTTTGINMPEPEGEMLIGWNSAGTQLQNYANESAIAMPDPSVDNAVARFNGTSGDAFQNSGVLIDDSNNVTGVVNLTASGTVAATTNMTLAGNDVLSTSNTKTVTNKTIDADNNTISNLAHGAEVDNPSSGVHGVTGSVVGTTDTQTLTNKTFNDAITIQDITTPSNPSAGYKKIYPKADGLIYQLNSSGVETPVGSGGAGGSIKWIEKDQAPIVSSDDPPGIEVYEFEDGITQYLYTFVKVPDSYIAGSPVNLLTTFYTSATSGTVLFTSVATLVRAGTDAVTSTTNQHTSTNSAITVSGSANVATSVTMDVSSGSGQINSVAISAGDLIFIRVTRDTGTDTAAATVKLLADSSEVTYV